MFGSRCGQCTARVPSRRARKSRYRRHPDARTCCAPSRDVSSRENCCSRLRLSRPEHEAATATPGHQRQAGLWNRARHVEWRPRAETKFLPGLRPYEHADVHRYTTSHAQGCSISTTARYQANPFLATPRISSPAPARWCSMRLASRPSRSSPPFASPNA